MVFEWEITKEDAGLYSCQASFYHHAAKVSFLAEVMSEEKLLGEYLPCRVYVLHSEQPFASMSTHAEACK